MFLKEQNEEIEIFQRVEKNFIFNYYVQRDLRAFMKTETVRGGKIEFLNIKNRIAKLKKKSIVGVEES